MMKLDDADLIEACHRKESKALKEIYERYAPKMYGVCLRYMKDSDSAEDVLHDGFIKAFSKIDNLRSIEAVEGWLRTIMINTALNALRKEKQTYELPDNVDISNDNLIDDKIYDNVDIEILMENIRALPPRYRAVFNLCEIEGYSYNEVATKLGIQPVSVRSNLMRAKRLLATNLKKIGF